MNSAAERKPAREEETYDEPVFTWTYEARERYFPKLPPVPTWLAAIPSPEERMQVWGLEQAAKRRAEGQIRDTGRNQANALYPVMGMCEDCQLVAATHRHHADEDPTNNLRSNVRFLCKDCHYAAHRRLGSSHRNHRVMSQHREERERQYLRACLQWFIDIARAEYTPEQIIADRQLFAAVYTAVAWTLHPKWIGYGPPEKELFPFWGECRDWKIAQGIARVVGGAQ